MNISEKQSFSINPKVIAHLGEDLIKNESIALLELVKNSYDACASECNVYFHIEKNGTLSYLEVSDDGFGMDIDTIRNVWLVIGTDNKRKQIEPNICGRYPLGEKGIGRLGIHKLGQKIRLFSKVKNGKEVEVYIDWSVLETVKSIDDFQIPITEHSVSEHFTEKSTGTFIHIEDLKSSWDKRQLREVYRNLTSLNSPFTERNDSFTVKITSNTNIFEGLPKLEDIIENGGLYFGHCTLVDDKIKHFKYEFKPWVSLNKIDKGRIVTENDLQQQELYLLPEEEIRKLHKTDLPELQHIDLKKLRIGTIDFDIIIFEKDAAIFNFVNTEKKSINEYLKENGGIRVYRDNVRLYDYGERDNDWLGIDLKRVHRVGGNVSNNIILGSVRLKRAESLGLREKTNREGFIEDEIYLAFVDAINYVLSLFVRLRNEDKIRLTTLYKKHKVSEPVLSDLNTVIELINDKVDEGEDKREILRYLYRIDDQYKNVKEVLIKSANAGLNLSVIIHEIEKLTVSLLGHAKQGETKRVIDIVQRLERIVRGYTAMIRKSSIGLYSLSSVVETALNNYEFRFIDHKIKILSNYKECSSETGLMAEAEAVSVLTNLLDNSIFWLTYARKEDRKISVYITKQFSGFNTIIISDNGPGFNIATDVAVQPFITGKPHKLGIGLGLHIANEMMHAMKGKLLFLDKDDVDFSEEIIKSEITRAIVALCFLESKE